METVLELLIKCLVLILGLTLAAAYMTLSERVLMARMQLRLGPNRVGPLGFCSRSPMGSSCLFKEGFQPAGVEKFTYWLAPGISLFIALFAFVLIPVGGPCNLWGATIISLRIADVNAGILFLLAFSSWPSTGSCLAGWASNDRYSLLGGLRGTAQMISYEIPMGISLLTVVMAAGTLSLTEIVEAQRYHLVHLDQSRQLPDLSDHAFAETNRAPLICLKRNRN